MEGIYAIMVRYARVELAMQYQAKRVHIHHLNPRAPVLLRKVKSEFESVTAGYEIWVCGRSGILTGRSLHRFLGFYEISCP